MTSKDRDNLRRTLQVLDTDVLVRMRDDFSDCLMMVKAEVINRLSPVKTNEER